jgi:hypothetical protein
MTDNYNTGAYFEKLFWWRRVRGALALEAIDVGKEFHILWLYSVGIGLHLRKENCGMKKVF